MEIRCFVGGHNWTYNKPLRARGSILSGGLRAGQASAPEVGKTWPGRGWLPGRRLPRPGPSPCSGVSPASRGRALCSALLGRGRPLRASGRPSRITRVLDFWNLGFLEVQAVEWNQCSPELLLSGSFDRSVVMMDMKSNGRPANKWAVASDVESIKWDPHNEHFFVVSLDDGTVQGYDVRAASMDSDSRSKACFTLHAHDEACCSVSYSPSAPNLLATGSKDKMVKLWDLSYNQPSCVASRNPKAGAVFSVAFSEDNPFSLAIGGSKGKLKVWDTLSEDSVFQKYGKLSNRKTGTKPEA